MLASARLWSFNLRYNTKQLPNTWILLSDPTRNYAVKATAIKPTAVASGSSKIVVPAERDPQKLHDYLCGGNLVKENREEIKVKEDHEYPDWLWELRTGKAPPIEELDPETKQYWRRLRTAAMRENNKRQKTKRC